MRQSRDLWANLSSANIADALRQCGQYFRSMDGGVRPVWPGARVVGPAFTVCCYPGATWALEQALELAKPGDVLVVNGGSADDVILMGGLMSRRALQRGLAGAIIDGAVRDVPDIAAMKFPLFSRHVCCRAGTFAEIGEWQTTTCCGRVPVSPGDFIVGDDSGISVIPRSLLDRVVTVARAICEKESRIDTALQHGRTIAEAANEATPKSTADAATNGGPAGTARRRAARPDVSRVSSVKRAKVLRPGVRSRTALAEVDGDGST